MKYFLTLVLVFSFSIAHSSTLRSYEGKLNEIKEIIELDISRNIPILKRVEGVKHLHHFIFNTPETLGLFGKDSLIQKVVLYEPHDFLLPEQDALAELYSHTLFFSVNGRDKAALILSFNRFKQELEQIKLLETLLKGKYKNLEIRRIKSMMYNITTSNKSYVKNLQSLINVISNYNAYLNNYSKIIFTDSSETSSLYQTGINTYESFFEDKDVLEITLSRYGHFSHINIITEEFIKDLFDIVFIKGFIEVEQFIFDRENLIPAIHALNEFLTAPMIDKLSENGIKRFRLVKTYDLEPELVMGEKLTLGLTKEVMQQIVELLF